MLLVGGCYSDITKYKQDKQELIGSLSESLSFMLKVGKVTILPLLNIGITLKLLISFKVGFMFNLFCYLYPISNTNFAFRTILSGKYCHR